MRELVSKDQGKPGVANTEYRDNDNTVNTKTGWNCKRKQLIDKVRKKYNIDDN